MENEIRVAIVEDQKQTREGLSLIVGSSPGYRVVGAFASMEEALARLDWDPPDVVLLDVKLPGMSGIEGVKRLHARSPQLPILMLTVYDDNEKVFEAICSGACGYLLKDTKAERLLEAIREVRDGGAPMTPGIARKVVQMFHKVVPALDEDSRLSPRELDVLRLLCDGHSYKTAAAALEISLDTVRSHIRNIYEKLHVNSKSEAVTKALRSGLLH